MVVAQAKKPLKELIKERGEAEAKTEVVLFLGSHRLPYVKKFEEMLEKKLPQVIVLEELKNDKFNLMLNGDMGVDGYMKHVRQSGYRFTDSKFQKMKYEFLQKFHKEHKEIIIEQLNPHLPQKLLESASLETIETLYLTMHGENFESAVGAKIDIARMKAHDFKWQEEKGVEEIAGKIKDGVWRGYILIEGGSSHTRKMRLLRREIGESDISVSLLSARSEEALEVFGRGEGKVYGPSEVFDPSSELIRMCISTYDKEELLEKDLKDGKINRKEFEEGKKLLEEKLYENGKLASARSLIFSLIKTYEVDTDDRAEFEAIKLVNQLDYNECREIFKKIHFHSQLKSAEMMNEQAAYNLVKTYVEKRDAGR